MDGAEATGVTIFKLASGMDCGPVMLSEKITINAEDDAGTLLERAAVLGASSFTKYAKTTLLEEWAFSPQDDLNATTADKIRGEEERIDWSKPASRIFGLARALNPKPGAWTTIRGRRLRVLKTMVIADVPSNLSKAPGELLGASGEGVLVATGEGALVLREVQMEGKKIQSAAEWWNGLRAAPEERLL
jgi:methionyl-tRNA formyltransferase